MTDSCEANFYFKREPHAEADQVVRHGVYVTAPRHHRRRNTAPVRARIGAVEWRVGQTYRAIDPDGVTAGGFSSSEGAAGFLLGRWLCQAPVLPVGDVVRFGEAWARRVNATPLARTPAGSGVTVELPGMRIHIIVAVGGSIVIELDSQDTATDPTLATADDLEPWAAAPLTATPRNSTDCSADSHSEPVPDVFTQIAAEFGEDRTDLIVAEHRTAHDSGARHSLEEVLGLYDLTIEDLHSGGDDPDGEGPEDRERPGSQR